MRCCHTVARAGIIHSPRTNKNAKLFTMHCKEEENKSKTKLGVDQRKCLALFCLLRGCVDIRDLYMHCDMNKQFV